MASTAKNFDEVFQEELREIRERREVCRSHAKPAGDQGNSDCETPPDDEKIEARLREGLTGLALSGGGVRSAAFNLGLLQALYHKGRMQDIDYLSTVSGGGYAGALFSASVANDKDSVNWSRESQFNRLSIEQRPDGSQPSRVSELALHGRAMSRPLQWLSRHLWGWILTLLFVISGVIAIASIVAWLMRIVWSQENLLTVKSQGFATDLHIAFYPAFLALLFWGFCNLVSVVMRAVNVRIPPISRFAYLLLIVTVVLGMVSFSAIGEFDMSEYVAAEIVPPGWSEVITDSLHNLAKLALGLLSLCLLPMLAPHRLLESGRRREKPLYRLAFNIAGFAIICGVPLAVFYLLSRENISGHNTSRPNSDMMTESHLRKLEQFVPNLAVVRPIEEGGAQNRHEQVARKLHDAMAASGEHEKYPPLQKEIIDDQVKVSMATRLLQYVAYHLGLHREFGELIERRRRSYSSRQEVAKSISTDVLTNPYLFDGMPERVKIESSVNKTDVAPASNSQPTEGTKAGNPGDKKPESIADSMSVLKELHLPKQENEDKLNDDKLKELQKSIQEIRVRRRALAEDYPALCNPQPVPWWGPTFVEELYRIYPEEKDSESASPIEKDKPVVMKSTIGNSFVLTRIINVTFLIIRALEGIETDIDRQEGNKEDLLARVAKEFPRLTGGKLNNRKTLRAILTAAVMDDLKGPRQLEVPGGGSPVEVEKSRSADGEVTIARRLTLLQNLLEMDSSGLVRKLDEKLTLALGDKYREDPEFQKNFSQFHQEEREKLAQQLQTIRTGNWAVLSAMYPDYITSRDSVYAWNVNAADQSFRLKIAGYSTLVFLFVGLLANLNRMCLHGVYRDQLAAVWLPTGPLMLKDLDTCRQGGPLHLFNATLNRHGKQLDPDEEGMSRFVFSNRFCGSKRFGYRETWEYENGEVGLADAVAISGAAVSTTYVGDLLFRTLLFLTNFRLGQWVRNPKHFHEEHYWPSPLRILISRLWHPTDRAYVDLTDGGHLDNTGLSSLLERRCRVMIVGDCSQDKDYQFQDLFAVLHAARAKYGIQIDELQDNGSGSDSEPGKEPRSIDALGRLIPDESKNFESQSHFAVFRLRYPEKRSAVLIVIKPTLTGDEPADLLARRRLDDGFPNDSTVNQFLDPPQFESYVMLGRHIGEQLDQFIRDGKLDRDDLPAPWCSLQQNVETIEDRSEQPKAPEAEQDRETPATAVTATGGRVVDQVTTDESGQPPLSSEIPGHNAVAQLLTPLRFDKPGIGVAIALVRQWAEAEYENDQEFLSASRDVVDHIIRPVSKWANEEGEHSPLSLRRRFCNKLIGILEEHTWIAKEADEEIRNDLRNMLIGLGDGVTAVSKTIASLAPDSEQVS